MSNDSKETKLVFQTFADGVMCDFVEKSGFISRREVWYPAGEGNIDEWRKNIYVYKLNGKGYKEKYSGSECDTHYLALNEMKTFLENDRRINGKK